MFPSVDGNHLAIDQPGEGLLRPFTKGLFAFSGIYPVQTDDDWLAVFENGQGIPVGVADYLGFKGFGQRGKGNKEGQERN